jgi:eukaryotic-like serine/threonine-protein kinase
MNERGQRIYRLDGIEIDTGHHCLRRNNQEQHLRLKTFQVLVYLLEQRDRLVSKDELIERVWVGTAVSDNTLEHCMAEIRKILGDDSRHPRFIKTVPRAGYRFIAQVEEIDSSATPAKPVEIPDSDERPHPEMTRRLTRGYILVAAAIAVIVVSVLAFYLISKRAMPDSSVAMTLPQDPTKRPVAVMFFDNDSGSGELDWLREGLPDMIITNLSRSKNLTLLSRQQLHILLDRVGYKQPEKIRLEQAVNIARQAQAKIVFLGSFAKLGDQIRIDVHLHDARDGQLLTAERLIVDQPAQILSQVDLLSLKLATYLGGNAANQTQPPLASVMTNNLEAFRYYSLGVEKAHALRNEEALPLLKKAIALDQNFAMAYARIGYVYGITGAAPEKSKPYLEKAFQLTDRLTEQDKLNIEAWYAIDNYDYAAAASALRRMVAGYPLEVEAYLRLGLLLKGEGKLAEAIEILKQGLVIDGGAKGLYNALGSVYSDTGRHNEGIAMYQRYVQLAPDEPNSHDSLGLGYQWAGRYDEAVQEYERALALKPDFEIAVIHLANTYFQQGRYQAARDQFARYIKNAPSDVERARGYFSLAYIELRSGNLEKAESLSQTTLKYDKTAFEPKYWVALQQNKLEQANKLKQEIEARQVNDRGVRMSLRPLWYVRGDYALKAGAADEAIEAFKQAVNQRPQIWHIRTDEDCLANAYLELGRLDEAIAEYQRILNLNPNYPLIHYHLALAYERKGQRDSARTEYERFLQVWKDADADIPEVSAARKSLAT